MRATLSRRPQVAAAVAVVSGLLALIVGTAATRRAVTAATSSFVAVPVAARALHEGTVVAPDDIRVVRVPPNAVPPALAPDAVGRTLTMPVLAGDPFLQGKLAPSGRGLAALLAPGQVAATVVPGTPVEVAAGERVRVTATFDPDRFAGDDLVRVLAPSALVLQRAEKDGALLLAVTVDERDRISLAEETARVDVAVLPPGG